MKALPLVVAGSATALAGCQPPAQHLVSAPPTVLPGGWTRGEDAQDGITVGIPPGWRQGVDRMFDMSGLGGMDLGNASAAGGQNNPLAGMAANLEQQDKEQEAQALAALRAKGVVLQAIDGSKPIPGEERTRFYVKIVDQASNCTLQDAAADEKDFLRGLHPVGPTPVKLPIGPAMRFDCDAKSLAGDEISEICYVLVDGKKSFSLRFVSTNNPQAVTGIAEPVAESLRIKPST